LITGITGFVGPYLAEHLLECGDEVAGLTRRGAWANDVPAAVRDRVALFTADLSTNLTSRSRRELADWSPEVMFHLAAISIPADCGDDEPSDEAIATNVAGTRALADLMSSFTNRPRVVFSGSCYVYGAVSENNPVVSEDSPLGPQSSYGVTKLAAEEVLLSAARDQQLDVIIARAFQHTGPRQSPRMILPGWAQQLTAPGNDPVRVICLDTFIDLSDVRDIVRAYRMLALKGTSGQIYNVGSGICRRSGDLLDLMRRLAKSSKDVVELSPGRRQHPIADINRISGEIGWRPVITIEQTLTDVLNYWKGVS
jgi:GDP-4-dehydro-6-deoxy-D-mannose reductase